VQLTTHLIATAALMIGQPGGDAPAGSPDFAKVSHAVVSLIDQVQVPAKQAGVLEVLALEDGSRVQEGTDVSKETVLGRLDDKDALARQKAAELDHQVSIAEAGKAEVAIEAADKTVAVAQAEYEESVYVNTRSPGAVPETQMRRQKLTEERSRAEGKVARSDAETAGLTVQLRDAQRDISNINLDRHSIKSPLDGVVVQVYRHVGEWVGPGDPILRIVHLNRLRVEGFIHFDLVPPGKVTGQPVTVQVAHSTRRLEGTIGFVSPLIQASGDYRVWCEIENIKDENGQWVLLPGMDAEMSIRLKK
jgi:macrolide-specific efflux system membrane fusion protein